MRQCPGKLCKYAISLLYAATKYEAKAYWDVKVFVERDHHEERTRKYSSMRWELESNAPDTALKRHNIKIDVMCG